VKTSNLTKYQYGRIKYKFSYGVQELYLVVCGSKKISGQIQIRIGNVSKSEEYLLPEYKIPVHTSQGTYYVSSTESRQLRL
jgi:hypothetical protein